MCSNSVIIITRTKWSEPPRLRHQVAKLLARQGYNVTFFEKPNSLLHAFSLYFPLEKSERIKTLPLTEVIHHQLCVFPFLTIISNLLVIIQLLLIRLSSRYSPLIVNFNYDFWFLRFLFGKARIVTILNDDFDLVSRIKLFNHTNFRIRMTCASSDKVLALSPQILKSLPSNPNYSLFTPWSPSLKKVFAPLGPQPRFRLVYWGFINDRLSLDTLTNLLCTFPSLHVTYIGPVEPSFILQLDRLSEYSNFSLSAPCQLTSIDTRDVLAFFIPYDTTHPISKTLYLPNKFLQLLSLGFPLIVPDLPGLVAHEALLRYNPACQKSLINIINSLNTDFISDLRPFIYEFLSNHSESSALQDIVGDCQG